MRTLILLGASVAFAAAAHGQLINDNFNSNPANPNNVGWYYSAASATTFSASGGGLQFVTGDTTSNVGIFKQFTETTIAVGETLQVSFTFTSFSSARTTTTNNHFRIGLFDTSSSDNFSSNKTANPWTVSGSTPQGYQMGIGAGTTPGTSQFGYRSANSNIVGFSAIGSAQPFGLSNFSNPVDVVFSITRTDTGISLSGSYSQTVGQNTVVSTFSSVTPGTSVYKFDTLVIGMGLNASGQGFTIDNVALSVVSAVPEPSAFAALAGVAALGFCATRRRRRA